jgi:BRCA1-associated protein
VENQDLRSEVANLNDLSNDLKAELVALNKEKLALEKKVNQQSLKLTSSLNDLNEERQLGKALRNNQQQWQNKLAKLQEETESKDKEIAELKEQVRDLMFFIDAKQVIEKSDEREDIAGGTITVGAEPARPKSKKGKKKR